MIGTVEDVKHGRKEHAPEKFNRYFGSPASRSGPVALRPRIPAGLPLSIPLPVKIVSKFYRDFTRSGRVQQEKKMNILKYLLSFVGIEIA